MSFILDALKKSENDRQDSTPAEFTTVSSSAEPAAAPRWLWILGGLLLLNTIVLAFVLLRPSTPAPMATVAATAPAAAPQTATPAAATPPPPGVETATAANETNFSARVAEARRDRPAPRPGVEQTTRPEPASRSTAAAPQSTAPASRPVPAARNEQVFLLPTLTELRTNGTLNIPDLHLDIHVYSEVPDDRFVFINMNKYRERDRTSEGPNVGEITPEGVILEFNGQRFLLPRE